MDQFGLRLFSHTGVIVLISSGLVVVVVSRVGCLWITRVILIFHFVLLFYEVCYSCDI